MNWPEANDEMHGSPAQVGKQSSELKAYKRYRAGQGAQEDVCVSEEGYPF